MQKRHIQYYLAILMIFASLPGTASALLLGQEIYGEMTTGLSPVSFTPNFVTSGVQITDPGTEFTGQVTYDDFYYNARYQTYYDISWDVTAEFTDNLLTVTMANGMSGHDNNGYNLRLEFTGFDDNSWSGLNFVSNTAGWMSIISTGTDNNALTLELYGLTVGTWVIEFQEPTPVPLPGAFLLFGTGLAFFARVRSRRSGHS
jgi:hypothetical protein